MGHQRGRQPGQTRHEQAELERFDVADSPPGGHNQVGHVCALRLDWCHPLPAVRRPVKLGNEGAGHMTDDPFKIV